MEHLLIYCCVHCVAHNVTLLVSVRSNLTTVLLEDLSVASLPITNLSDAVGLDMDPTTNRIFWTDITKDTINTAAMDVRKIWYCIVSGRAQKMGRGECGKKWEKEFLVV